MADESLNFSFDMKDVDRSALLTEAAERLDAFGWLGEEEKEQKETAEALLARALLDDVAQFTRFPDVYKITDKDFITKNLKVPIQFKELAKSYNFYWLYFPIALHPKRNWAFNRLELAIEFNPGQEAAHSLPRAYQILPEKKFQTLMETKTHLEIALDENFEFSAKTGAIEVKAGDAEGRLAAGVDVKAAAGMGFVAGPFVYRIKKAKINHTPAGMERVFWRLDGAEFFQEDDPPLVVIAQVPKETKEVKIAAAMQAYRYFNLGASSFQDAIRELPAAIRNFFKGGAPLRDEASWDITPKL